MQVMPMEWLAVSLAFWLLGRHRLLENRIWLLPISRELKHRKVTKSITPLRTRVLLMPGPAPPNYMPALHIRLLTPWGCWLQVLQKPSSTPAGTLNPAHRKSRLLPMLGGP